MDAPFYSEGLQFKCQQCSLCCRKDPGFVYLSKKDLTKLIHCFNLNIDVFIDKYCRWVPYYDGHDVLCLKEKKNYDCIFWDNGCTAYKSRPIQCSTYPFWTFLLESKENWLSESKDCPGINKGENHSCSEIQSKMLEYKKNTPIHKDDLLGDIK